LNDQHGWQGLTFVGTEPGGTAANFNNQGAAYF
jgi:hypothetical protein